MTSYSIPTADSNLTMYKSMLCGVDILSKNIDTIYMVLKRCKIFHWHSLSFVSFVKLCTFIQIFLHSLIESNGVIFTLLNHLKSLLLACIDRCEYNALQASFSPESPTLSLLHLGFALFPFFFSLHVWFWVYIIAQAQNRNVIFDVRRKC